jgi:hypothetical protein
MRNIFFIIILIFAPLQVGADEFPDDDLARRSPKSGWGDFTVVEEKESYAWWQHALLWLPNRFLDLIDVFRADVGLGPSVGGVIRVTRYGQAGFRTMAPGSLRIGNLGRNPPVMIETSNEFGVGPAYVKSKDRDICTGELGAGADIMIAGAYLGFCPEEFVDFVAGLFFLDVMDDDVK